MPDRDPELTFEKIVQVAHDGDWHPVTLFDHTRQKRIRGHSIKDFKSTLTERLKQHIANQRDRSPCLPMLVCRSHEQTLTCQT
jgi:hypothetical protein